MSLARVFFDTNLFIYLFEGHPVFAPTVDRICRSIRAKGLDLVTGAMTVAEVLEKPVNEGDLRTASLYRDYFASGLVEVVPFDEAAAQLFPEIRKGRTISRQDAIQLSCAARAGCSLFLTNDERLARQSVAEVPYISSMMQAPL